MLLDAPALSIRPRGPVAFRVSAPASKSATNRLLAVAALAEGTSRLRSPLDSDDARAMRGAVQALGATVTDDGADWLVEGTGGRLAADGRSIDCGLSGTTMRFATALAALSKGRVSLTGQPPLLRRPIGPLTAALRDLGASAADDDGHPPAVVGGGLRGGSVSIDVTGSSQYASAVLLSAPYAASAVQVSLTGPFAASYIEMTTQTMQRWGAAVAATADGWLVQPGPYLPQDEAVEYDASAAAHLFALAVATGGEVTVDNTSATLQPDARLTDVLRAMGASVDARGQTTVVGSSAPRGVDVDLSAMPDQVTTVAALAALADGTSTIRGAAVTRGHETDRLAALATELHKLQVPVEERPDGLVITGGNACGPARLRTYDDHRLAMAFAAIAARVPDVVIEHPGCVTKTYPAFWDDLVAGGVDVRPVP